MEDQKLKIGAHEFDSRLIIGTGKYPTPEIMVKAHEASGAGMVTVAVARVNLDPARREKSLLDYVDRKKYTLLPNTAGAYTAEEAIRIAHLARAAGLGDLIKLEVLGDQKTLLPDVMALLEATEILVKEGFVVMPYTNDDPVVAKKLETLGVACVMPLAAPIGSGRGIQNRLNLKFILEAVSCPVIVDAGVGTASDASICMELGADGVLMNTAIALAGNPILMAEAMREAVSSGRKAYLAGRIPMKDYGSASSPQERFESRGQSPLRGQANQSKDAGLPVP
ncbi:MAG: thiazole synthase [Candidatus Omnitrophica bacterium]|nr:thiazole synthase [Candidatus Omnitrophota bacterium]